VVGRLLQSEMRLKILTPILIPGLTFHWTTCEDGAPWWGYAIAVASVFRAKYFEWSILRRVTRSGWGSVFTLAFAVGLMDHLDWYTDGFFIAHAYKCDPRATERFMQMVNHSLLTPMAPLFRLIGFWSLAVASVVSALVTQQTLGSEGHQRDGLRGGRRGLRRRGQALLRTGARGGQGHHQSGCRLLEDHVQELLHALAPVYLHWPDV